MPTSVMAAVVGGVLGGMALDKMMSPGDVSTPQAPEVKPPSPMPVSPEIDPKQKAKAEQSMLASGLSGEAPMSRSSTILGKGTLG